MLVAAGYDVLGVDPAAPEGPGFTRARFQDVEGAFDAVVAGRVLHHVNPLDEGIAKLASLAPLLVVDEFAPDRAHYDERALEWLPYLHRWLGGPSSEALESTLVSAGAIRAIGYRWVGTVKSGSATPARR